MKRPFCLAVAGGSGSGKSTFVRGLLERLPQEEVSTISLDSYYRPQSGSLAERALANFDHPDALDVKLLGQHLQSFKRGQSVQVPRYDFVRHQRLDDAQRVEPRPLLLVDGVLLLACSELLEHFDLKVFVEVEPDERVLRRMERDVKERGRTWEGARDQLLQHVLPMHREFVEPSRRRADLIIPHGGKNAQALDVIQARLLQALSDSLVGPG